MLCEFTAALGAAEEREEDFRRAFTFFSSYDVRFDWTVSAV